jgi:ATP-dependent phosphofructokinase / diphosphate-dependent phosphofructokinase
VLATRFGVAAVELIAEGKFGQMVALRGDSIVAVDVSQAIGQLKTVRPDGELVRTARAIGIGFGD